MTDKESEPQSSLAQTISALRTQLVAPDSYSQEAFDRVFTSNEGMETLQRILDLFYTRSRSRHAVEPQEILQEMRVLKDRLDTHAGGKKMHDNSFFEVMAGTVRERTLSRMDAWHRRHEIPRGDPGPSRS